MLRIPRLRLSALKFLVPALLLGGLVVKALGASDRERAVRVDVTRDKIVFDTLGSLELGDSVFTRGGLSWDTAHWIGTLVEQTLQVDTNRHGRLVIAPEGAVPLGLVDDLMEPMRSRQVKRLDTVWLELPGGAQVRVHNLPWGHAENAAEAEGKPLRLLLEDSSFLLLDGTAAQGIRLCGRPDRAESLDSLQGILKGFGFPERRRDIVMVTRRRSRMPISRLIALARLLDRSTGHGFALSADDRQHRLLEIEMKKARGQEWIDWGLMKFRKSDVLDPAGAVDTGMRLEGLERLHFRRTSIETLMESAAGMREEFVASSDGVAVARLLPLLLTTKLPRVESHDEEPEYPTARDFPIPVKIPGHTLVLREVLLQHYTMKEHPCWWALYDNGRRSDLWTYAGSAGLMLPNYTVHALKPGKGGGLLLQLEGALYRNRYSCEKGVELTFGTTTHGVKLERVRNAFTFFNGAEEIRTESCNAERCTSRERSDAKEVQLKACRFRNPAIDEEWRFDWEKLTKVATCVTRSPKAKVTTRKVTEPSFIEVGWKPDTTAR